MRAGVIGVGAIGKNHARIYSEIDTAELVVVYDTDKEAAESMVSSYGGEVSNSIEEFIDLVDVVSIDCVFCDDSLEFVSLYDIEPKSCG